MSPAVPITNEPNYDVTRDEPELDAIAIIPLQQRTKKKGRAGGPENTIATSAIRGK